VTGRPRIAVVTFPGSNDDGDAALALDAVGADPIPVWHGDSMLPAGCLGALLPGGFSYGDYLRCGAIARTANIMSAIGALASAGAPVLGVCNGFQVLCEVGLLPGVLRMNRDLEFICEDVDVTVETTDTSYTAQLTVGDVLTIPIKHGEGNWFADDSLFEELVRHDQIVLRYAVDTNGARDRVAAVCDRRRNVFGLMPHPEHAVDALLGPTGGLPLLEGFVAFAASRAPALV
jgi:phosphoribosylformylglycinamidine synthase subunit PurQ / glutaminase